jgi:hypothetical protein
METFGKVSDRMHIESKNKQYVTYLFIATHNICLLTLSDAEHGVLLFRSAEATS